MKKAPLISQENPNYFDKDLLVETFCKIENILKELPELKGINSYQGFITKLEENISKSDFPKAITMAQTLIREIDNDIKYNSDKRIEKFIQENNIIEMDEKFLELSQDQRILITQYRHENNKGENYSKDKNFGCGTYGYFKVNTTCGSCISGGKNLATAGLRKLANFLGDRQNKLPDDIIDNAIMAIFTKEDKKEIQQLKSDLNGYLQKIKILEQQQQSKKAIIDFFTKHNQAGDYNTVLKLMPAFASYVQEKELFRKNINALNIFQEDGLVIYVSQGSQINGTGPMTYWITTTIWYDGQEKSFRHIVRDPSNPDYYDTSFYQPKLKLLSQQEKGENIEFKIRVINNDNSNYLDYISSFKRANPNTIAKLNEEEQEKFKKLFEKTIQETCKSETRENGIMFSRVNNTRVERPRDKAEITDKYLDLKNGIGAFILKTQIDSGANASDRNKQYGRRGYIVNSDGKVDNVRYQCGREEQLGLMDFSISDPHKIDKEKVKAIFDTTAQSLLEK
ncbi:hypothetical protein K9M48_02360 [Candidatus Gracilibacteria bacterium]|nr:hypothetical protein [Candidatus Gracilibacteria bacterium]